MKLVKRMRKAQKKIRSLDQNCGFVMDIPENHPSGTNGPLFGFYHVFSNL
jgi:hypothetical protein